MDELGCGVGAKGGGYEMGVRCDLDQDGIEHHLLHEQWYVGRRQLLRTEADCALDVPEIESLAYRN